MKNRRFICFVKRSFCSFKSFLFAGKEDLKALKYKKILSALSLFAVAEIPLIDAYLSDSISFSYFFNFYSLVFASVCIYKLFGKRWGNILTFILQGIWVILFLTYYIFNQANLGGLGLENIYHLVCFKGWLEFLFMDPQLFFKGVSAIVVLLLLSYGVTRWISWMLPSSCTRATRMTYSCLLFLFAGGFLYGNIVFSQLNEIVGNLFFAEKYRSLEQKYYADYGIKIYPFPWQMVHAEAGKNLVYIILESTELSFLDQNRFPGLLPNLTDFRKNAQSFDNLSMAHNAQTTFGGIYSAMSGSYLTPSHLLRGLNKWWDPNVSSYFSSLPRILHKAGYEQHFLVGHSGNFAGTESFVRDQTYDVFWSAIERRKRVMNWMFSVRDSVVFEQAWQQFQRLAEKETPFHITLLTIDAHGPDGFYSPDEPPYPGPLPKNNLYNAMYASDYALGKFLRRIQNHPKYKDTCIVISSDHLAHEYTSCSALLNREPQRRLLFLIQNSSEPLVNPKVPAATFDIGPTILDALGVKHDYIFPLGESLYRRTDPRRLDFCREQERILYFYVLLKNKNRTLNFPLDVALSKDPYPSLLLNTIRLPLLVNGANDLPSNGEIVAIPLPSEKDEIKWDMRFYRSWEYFYSLLRKTSGDIVFFGKTPNSVLKDSVKQNAFFLGYKIRGQYKVIYHKDFSKLQLHYP